MTAGDLGFQIVAHSLLVESANLHFRLFLLLSAHRAEVGSHGGNREVAQSERVVEPDSQTICIDVPVAHSIVVEELEQTEALVVQKDELFLSEDLLTAIAFLIELVRLMSGYHGSIKHVDERALCEFDEGDVIEDCARIFIYDENFLVHMWEELLFTILAIVPQELHELGLIDNIEEGDFVLIFNLFGHFDRVLLVRARHFVQSG